MLRASLLAAFALSSLSVACSGGDDDGGGSGAADAATASQADARVRADAAPQLCYASDTAATVDVAIQIEEDCAIWNSLDLLSGDATLTREGDQLTIDFGDGIVFSGTITGDQVVLTYVHLHDFTDGCGWQATETMAGTIGADCALSLTYDYVESVVEDNGGCASPCAANADVTLEFTIVD